MDDLISRQAAIDAINEAMIGKTCDTDGTRMASITNEYVIKRLPSAGPGIKPCDYVKACMEVSMGKLTSAYYYLDALEELKKHGYVLVDMREVTYGKASNA